MNWEYKPDSLSSGAVVIVQHSAETLASLDPALVPKVVDVGIDEPIGQALTITLGVVMRGCLKRS